MHQQMRGSIVMGGYVTAVDGLRTSAAGLDALVQAEVLSADVLRCRRCYRPGLRQECALTVLWRGVFYSVCACGDMWVVLV